MLRECARHYPEWPPAARVAGDALFDPAMAAGANSYRQMHEFIRIHRRRFKEAFGLRLPMRRPTPDCSRSCADRSGSARGGASAARRDAPAAVRDRQFDRDRR